MPNDDYFSTDEIPTVKNKKLSFIQPVIIAILCFILGLFIWDVIIKAYTIFVILIGTISFILLIMSLFRKGP